MNAKEVIRALELMQAQIEWAYPLENAAALDEAIKAVGIVDKIKKIVSEVNDES